MGRALCRMVVLSLLVLSACNDTVEDSAQNQAPEDAGMGDQTLDDAGDGPPKDAEQTPDALDDAQADAQDDPLRDADPEPDAFDAEDEPVDDAGPETDAFADADRPDDAFEDTFEDADGPEDAFVDADEPEDAVVDADEPGDAVVDADEPDDVSQDAAPDVEDEALADVQMPTDTAEDTAPPQDAEPDSAQDADEPGDVAVEDVPPDLSDDDVPLPDAQEDVQEPVDPLAALSDDFDAEVLDGRWQALNPQQVDVEVNGQLSMTAVGRSLWFEGSTGPLLYQTVEGDFKVTSLVQTSRAQNPLEPPIHVVHLAGLIARDPAFEDGEDYVFIVVGFDVNDLSVETKSTDDSNSDFVGPSWPDGDAELRICRLGQTFTLLKRRPGAQQWEVAATHERPDMAQGLQVGPIIYANRNQSDLRATFDAVDFATIADMDDCLADD